MKSTFIIFIGIDLSEAKLSKKVKRKTVIPKHDRHCQYWAGCDPLIGEEGYCDCGLSETETEPEVYAVLEDTKKPKKQLKM